ncbi:MAG: amidase [Acidiferrobacterales bacterium]|nr:amidase [Acidiferrobacterales bacterium]
MTTLNELSLKVASDMIARDEISPNELLADCFARIHLRHREVLAFTHFDEDRSIYQLSQLRATQSAGPLVGIPVGIKDIMDTSEFPTTKGSSIYTDEYPQRDAACVTMCKNAGCIIPGKTETTEFAYFSPGRTRNPHNLSHTPGGSSMGSAAAVADFMLPLALGSQTAASVIRPAAYCGVVGYKASHGLFSLEGVCGLAQSLDSLGFFVREVEDLQVLRKVFLGVADQDRDSFTNLRVGLVRTPHWNEAEPYQREIVESTAKRLSHNGCDVEEVQVGPSDDALTAAQITVMAYEVSRSLDSEYTMFYDLLSDQIKDLIESGRKTSFDEYINARSLARTWQQKLATVHEQFDVLLTASAPGEAPSGLDSTGDPIFSRMWTLLQVPSISLPAGFGPNKLPLGIQLIGAYNKDDVLIDNARKVAQVL